MKNPSKNKADPSPGQSTDPSADESGVVADETHGNRAEEKIEDRATKKQEMHEEAKAITGSEPHKDITNKHPGEGPAPLDRY